MKKKYLLLIVPILVCIGSLTYAFNTKVSIPKSEVTFSTPKEAIEYLFNQWDFEFPAPNPYYEPNNNDGITLDDKFITPLSQRKKVELYLTSENHQTIVPDHSSAKVKLLNVVEANDEFANSLKEDFLKCTYNSHIKDQDVKVFNVDYEGVNTYSDNPNNYELFKRNYILIKENNSWVIEDLGQGVNSR